MNRKRLFILNNILFLIFCISVWPVAAVPNAQTEMIMIENTSAALEAPVPETSDHIFDSKVVGFYWSPSANAEYYEINVENGDGAEGTIRVEGDDSTCLAGRCIHYEAISDEGDYTWTVTAFRGEESAVSDEVHFLLHARIPKPQAYRPNGGIANDRTITFEWADVSGNPTEFRVQAADRSSGKIYLDQWYPANGMYIGNGICYQETDLYLPIGSYSWRVKARNSESESDWSDWTAFDITCEACMLGTYTNSTTAVFHPVSTIQGGALSFSWRAVTGAFSYELTLQDSAGNTVLDEELPATEFCDYEKCVCAIDFALSEGESYHWAVITHGWNNSQWGTAEADFTVGVPSAAEPVAFILPENNGYLRQDDGLIIWTDPGAQTAVVGLEIRDNAGNTLFIGNLTREDAWCDGITCSIQFKEIPFGNDYSIILTPYSDEDIPGEPASLTFNVQ